MRRSHLNDLINRIQEYQENKNEVINQLHSENNSLRYQITTLETQLNEKDNVISAYEDKWNDASQIQLRLDELGRVQQTTEGTGSAFDPYKYWSAGTEVHTGEWWQMEPNGYIWEAKKDGIPASDTDSEYWDIMQ